MTPEKHHAEALRWLAIAEAAYPEIERRGSFPVRVATGLAQVHATLANYRPPAAPDPADNDPRHIIEFRTDGWTIKHPLACRPNLFDCPVNRAAEAELGTRRCPPAPPGRYECRVGDRDLAGMFLLGDRVDQDGADR